MFDPPVPPPRCQSTKSASNAGEETGDDFHRVACPHMDRNDTRCGHRFTLGRLDQAFSVCLGGYGGCPIYHRITNELQHPDIEITVRRAPHAALTALTLHARHPVTNPTRADLAGQPTHLSALALRRTGT